MFYRRMLLDTTETAMMIGEHQPVFRYDYSRTKAAETDNGIRQTRLLRLAKQYATLGLTGQKGPAGSADLSCDEGESGFIRTIFNLQELMTDEIGRAHV